MEFEKTSFCNRVEGRMAERSKALVLGTSHFGGAGSNPAPVKFFSLLLACTTSVLPLLQNLMCLLMSSVLPYLESNKSYELDNPH